MLQERGLVRPNPARDYSAAGVIQATPLGSEIVQQSGAIARTTPFGEEIVRTTPFGEEIIRTTPFGEEIIRTTPFGEEVISVANRREYLRELALWLVVTRPAMRG